MMKSVKSIVLYVLQVDVDSRINYLFIYLLGGGFLPWSVVYGRAMIVIFQMN